MAVIKGEVLMLHLPLYGASFMSIRLMHAIDMYSYLNVLEGLGRGSIGKFSLDPSRDSTRAKWNI